MSLKTLSLKSKKYYRMQQYVLSLHCFIKITLINFYTNIPKIYILLL